MGQWSHLYNNRQWRALRRRQLDAEPLCRYCRKEGKIEAATVCDHVKPHKGNLTLFWSGPFQSLCLNCHNSIKQQMEKSGYASGCDPAGVPLDQGHHWAGE